MEHTDIYCVILFPSLKRALTLNRDYEVIDTANMWKSLPLGVMIDTSSQFFPPNVPAWAQEAQERGYDHVAMWTNYYE